jgi:hypothetical protein
MAIDLYQEVTLTQDLPEYQLRAGDLATVIDIVPHPTVGEDGYILEVFNAIGVSLAVIIVPQSVVKALESDTILTVRSLLKTA